MPTPYQHDSSARATRQAAGSAVRANGIAAAPKARPSTRTAVTEGARVISIRRAEWVFPKARIVMVIMAMFALCFLIVYRYSILSDMNFKLGRLTSEYDGLRETNRLLKVDIESTINLAAVREIAVSRFGMHEPGQSQIVSVNVPKTGYSVVEDSSYIEETESLNEDFLTRASSSLGQLVR